MLLFTLIKTEQNHRIMSKALRVKIIDYLRHHDAVTQYIDIRAHVLGGNDSVEQRNELKVTLDYLSNNRFIAINGSYEFLHWKLIEGLYNLDNKVIAAKLTHKGLKYHPDEDTNILQQVAKPVLAVVDHKPHEHAAHVSTIDEPPVNNMLTDVKPLEGADDIHDHKVEEIESVNMQSLPVWQTEVKTETPFYVPEPVVEKNEPIVYKFPPIGASDDVAAAKADQPMMIEIINENLSQGIDAISNIKIRKPEVLTGDFERDYNVILKFILVVVLFLLFSCIVWLYMA